MEIASCRHDQLTHFPAPLSSPEDWVGRAESYKLLIMVWSNDHPSSRSPPRVDTPMSQEIVRDLGALYQTLITQEITVVLPYLWFHFSWFQ